MKILLHALTIKRIIPTSHCSWRVMDHQSMQSMFHAEIKHKHPICGMEIQESNSKTPQPSQ